MSDADEPTEDAGKKAKKAKKEKGGGRSNLVPAVLLTLGLLGGGYFMGPAAQEAKVAAANPKPEEDLVAGEVATMEPININLAEGHFLRVGIGLQLVEGVDVKAYTAGKTSKANDIVIAELGGHAVAEMSTPEGYKKMKEALKEKIVKAYETPDGKEVMDIYITNFVMQ